VVYATVVQPHQQGCFKPRSGPEPGKESEEGPEEERTVRLYTIICEA
jgi:hypothetical protein